MKVYICTPLDKGYQLDSCDTETKEDKVSAHQTRKNAVIRILGQIPASKQFHVVVMEDE